MGIKLRDSESEFRNFGDVLDEVGAKWENLSSVQQQALAVAMSGTRMQNKFKALMENYPKSLDEERIALDSSGTAMQKFSVYQESVEAKTQRMTAAFEAMSTSILDSGLIVWFMDAGTELFNFASEIPDGVKNTAMLTAGIITMKAAFSALGTSTFGTSFISFFKDIGSIIPNANALGYAMQAFAQAQNGAATSASGLATALQRLASEQIANLAISRGLGEAELGQILNSAQLGIAKEKEIGTIYNAAIAKGVDKSATGALNISMKNLWATTKTFLTSVTGLLTIATIAIPIAIALFDKLNVTTEEHIEKLKELEGEYESVTSELNDAEKELSDIAKRMEELQNIQSPTLVEQKELRTLVASNTELERSVILLKQRKEALEAEKSVEADAAWASMNKLHVMGRAIYDPVYNDNGSVVDYNTRFVSDVEYAKYAIEQLRQAEEELTSLSDEEIALDGGAQLRSLEARINGYKSILGTIRDDAADIGTDDAIQFVDTIIYAMGDAEDKSTIFSNKLKELEANGHKSFSEIAASTEVTAENLEELVGTDAAETLNAISGAAEQTAIELNKLAEVAENPVAVVNTLAEKLHSLEDETDALTAAMDALSSGNLDTFLTKDDGKALDALLKKFPDLRDELTAYADSLISADQLQKAFNSAIEDFNADAIYNGVSDIVDAFENYGASSNQVLQEVQNLERFIPGLTGVIYDNETGLLKVDSAALSTANSIYGLINAAIEMQRVAAEADYMNMTTSFKDLARSAIVVYGSMRAASGVSKDEYYNRKLQGKTSEYGSLDELNAYFDSLLYSVDRAFNRNDTKSGSSSKADLYVTEIDKLYESAKRLEDIRNRMDTIEAKGSQLDVEDYRQRNEYVKETIRLRQQENDVLNEQNNIRRQLIQTGVDKLRGQGFVVDYDAASNNLLIRNMEHINALSGGSIELTNKLRKETESLISDIEKLNDDAIAASLSWHKNSAQNIEDIKELADNIKAASDAYLQDSDHELGLMKRHGATDAALIAKLDEQKAAVHNFAEEVRRELSSLGVPSDVIESLDVVQDLSAKWFDIDDKIKDIYKEQLDNLEDLVDLTRDMIKQEKEDLIDALEAQKDAYSDLITLKKRSLELTEQERSYTENVNDKTKEISRLQARIDALGLDDSRSAQAERGALLEQLAEKQRELDDLQREHAINSQQDALDQEQKDFEDTKDREIKKIRDFLNDNEAMTKAALSRIDAMSASTFDDLLSYSRRYTNVAGAELETMWDNAIDAAKRYGSVTDALSGLKKESGGSWNEPAITNAVVTNKVKTMQSNSMGWKTASAGEREKLVAENERLASEIEALLHQKLVRGADGEWYIGSTGGKRLYEVYHEGTPSVGGSPTPKQNELWALMEKKEMVLKPEHQDNLLSAIKSFVPSLAVKNLLKPISALLSGDTTPKTQEIKVDASIHVTGAVDEQVLQVIKRHPRTVANEVARVLG